MTKFSFLPLALLCCLATPVLGQEPTPLVTRSEPELLKLLATEGSLKERVDACRELSVIGTASSVPVLVPLLSDPVLSHMARYALETLPDPSVDEALRQALVDTDGRIRLGVISSLGARGDEKAVKLLSALLDEADAESVQAAARALGRIGTSGAASALLKAATEVDVGNRLALQEGTFRCAEAMFARGDRTAARKVYAQLRQAGGDHQVRAGAVRGFLLASDRSESLELMRESLQAEDYVVAAVAVRASQEMAGPGVTAVLVAALPGLSTDRQILVLRSLGERGDVTALTGMETFIRGSAAPEARVVAVEALAGMREPEVTAVLVSLVEEQDPVFAVAAQESLAALPFPEVDAAVMALLRSSDRELRLVGLELVGRRRLVSAMSALLEAMRDNDAKIRSAALRRVGELGGAEEFGQLLEMLSETKQAANTDAVEQAMTAVAARSDSPEALGSGLIRALPEASAPVKQVLIRLLGVVGGSEALKTVCAAVDDENADVHRVALRTLSTWESVEAAPELLALAKSVKTPADRALCLRGYLSWARNSELETTERLRMCGEGAELVQSDDEKKLLLSAAGSIRSAGALVYVTPQLENEAIRAEAAVAVASIAEPLLKGPTDAEASAQLVEALKQALATQSDESLAKRLQGLLEEASSRVSKE